MTKSHKALLTLWGLLTLTVQPMAWAQTVPLPTQPQAAHPENQPQKDAPNDDQMDTLLTAINQEDKMASEGLAKKPTTAVRKGQFITAVTLAILDKLTGRIAYVTAQVGKDTIMNNISIRVLKCWQSTGEDIPETVAFLEIYETSPDKQAQLIFRNWLFASHPSAVTLEHPVYDVWILKRPSDDNTAPTPPTATEESAEKQLDHMLEKIFDLPPDDPASEADTSEEPVEEPTSEGTE